MCGRYQFYDGKNKEIYTIIQKVKAEQQKLNLGEIYPSMQGIVLKVENNTFEPCIMTWGYPKKDKKVLIINARNETITQGFFKDDYLNRRCIVPVCGFYEWDSNKKKHYIHSNKDEVLYLAAIYRKIDNTYHYCILTQEASDRLKTIHDRQPIVMNEKQALDWCLS